MIKVRLQNQPHELQPVMYRGYLHTARRIAAEEGILSLWTTGLGASVLRDLSYSSIRLGMAPMMIGWLSGGSKDPNVGQKFAGSFLTGALGSALCNPFDVAKIRLQRYAGRVKDGMFVSGLHKGEQVPYSGTADVFRKIVSTEGIARGLYGGASITAVRAALLTAGQVTAYMQSKGYFKRHGYQETMPLHFICAIASALTATTLSQPADVIKSRILSAPKDPRFPTPAHFALHAFRTEGPGLLMRGWVASFARLGPHFCVSLPLLEVFRRLLGLDYF